MSQTRKLHTIDEMLRMLEEILQSYPEDNDSYLYERDHLSKWIAFVQSKSTAVSLLQDQYTFKLILETFRNLKHDRSSYPFLHLEESDGIFVDRLTKLYFNNHITNKYQLETGDSNCSMEIMILGHFAFQILQNGSEQGLLAHTIKWASARFGVPATFILQSINNLNLLIPGDDKTQSSFLIPQMKLIFASNYFSWFYIMLGDIPESFKTSRVYGHKDMDESERQQITKFLSVNRENPRYEELYTRILYSLSDPMDGPELVPGADEFRKVLLYPIKHKLMTTLAKVWGYFEGKLPPSDHIKVSRIGSYTILISLPFTASSSARKVKLRWLIDLLSLYRTSGTVSSDYLYSLDYTSSLTQEIDILLEALLEALGESLDFENERDAADHVRVQPVVDIQWQGGQLQELYQPVASLLPATLPEFKSSYQYELLLLEYFAFCCVSNDVSRLNFDECCRQLARKGNLSSVMFFREEALALNLLRESRYIPNYFYFSNRRTMEYFAAKYISHFLRANGKCNLPAPCYGLLHNKSLLEEVSQFLQSFQRHRVIWFAYSMFDYSYDQQAYGELIELSTLSIQAILSRITGIFQLFAPHYLLEPSRGRYTVLVKDRVILVTIQHETYNCPLRGMQNLLHSVLTVTLKTLGNGSTRVCMEDEGVLSLQFPLENDHLIDHVDQALRAFFKNIESIRPDPIKHNRFGFSNKEFQYTRDLRHRSDHMHDASDFFLRYTELLGPIDGALCRHLSQILAMKDIHKTTLKIDLNDPRVEPEIKLENVVMIYDTFILELLCDTSIPKEIGARFVACKEYHELIQVIFELILIRFNRQNVPDKLIDRFTLKAYTESVTDGQLTLSQLYENCSDEIDCLSSAAFYNLYREEQSITFSPYSRSVDSALQFNILMRDARSDMFHTYIFDSIYKYFIRDFAEYMSAHYIVRTCLEETADNLEFAKNEVHKFLNNRDANTVYVSVMKYFGLINASDLLTKKLNLVHQDSNACIPKFSRSIYGFHSATNNLATVIVPEDSSKAHFYYGLRPWDKEEYAIRLDK